jgi:replicative superfamily II helicase
MVKCLFALSNLVRINGIASATAVTFYEAGYKSIKDIINSTKEEMLNKITKVNDEKKYYKAKLGLKDMQFVIDYANMMVQLEK